MFNGNGISLADIAAVSGRNNDGNWGNDWVWVLLFALWGWGGFGNGGWGGGGQNGGVGSEVQRSFDTQTILTKLDGLNSGICSLGYDQLAQMNNIGQTVTTTGYNIERAIQADTIANMQNQNALSTQISGCCCDMREALANIKYDMATSDCSIKTLMNQLAQQLGWQNQQAFRDLSDLINDRFNQLTIQQKDALITELTQKLNNCDRDNALQSMATYILNTLQPRPVPTYPGANPNGVGNWSPNVLANGQMSYGGCCGNVA